MSEPPQRQPAVTQSNPQLDSGILGAIAIALAAALPVTSLTALVLLLSGHFSPWPPVLAGLVAAVFACWRLRPFGGTSYRMLGVVMLLLVTALALRWPPSLYLQGGQDEGVYMAMAAHFLATGSRDVIDPVRSRLTTDAARTRFDSNIRTRSYYQPGVYLDRQDATHFIFQFYDIHPLWMAVFGGILGLQWASLSQIFFGLVSILFFALLAARLSRDRWLGIVAGAILVVLPLHVFFSKFPISEMPTLAFAMIGIWAGVRFRDSTCAGRPRYLWLWIALLAFASLFFTRISGFVYLPAIYVLALGSLVLVEDRATRRAWLAFSAGLFTAYALSVEYGLIWSWPYSHDIYRMHLGAPALGWMPWLMAAASLLALIPFALFASSGNAARVRAFCTPHQARFWNLLPWLALAIIVTGLLRVVLLGFTDVYQGHHWYDQSWHVSGTGIAAFKYSALVVLGEHITPWLALALPFALRRGRKDSTSALLAFMVIVMLIYTAALQWFIPYQYYYARYLLSEFVPWALLLVLLWMHDRWRRTGSLRWPAVAGFACLAYWMWFTWPLIGWREARGDLVSARAVTRQVALDDALVLDIGSLPWVHRLGTPLRFWFQRNLYPMMYRQNLDEIVKDLHDAGFRHVYLMTAPNALSVPASAVIPLHYTHTIMAHRPYIPRTSGTVRFEAWLVELDPALLR